MPEDPYHPLLHRELHIHDVEEHFSDQLVLLRDIVNYGTKLIPACLTSSDRSLGDAIVIAVLLKQVISMLDGLEVLISNACVPTGLLQARAIFEASAYIDFVLAGEKDRKAEFYYVANIRKDLQWARRTQSGDDEEARFRGALGDFADVLEPTRERLEADGEEHINTLQDFFEREPWSIINARFDELRGNRPFDPNWYVEFGPRSFRQLNEAVGRLHEYELFYTVSSEKMHGSDFRSHIRFAQGEISLSPIRNLSAIAAVLNFSLSSALHTYQCVLNEYRPGQIREYSERYMRDWREPFLDIRGVTYVAGDDGGPVQI